MPVEPINGFEMAYEVSGSGPLVVFVHGGVGGIVQRLQHERPWWVDEIFAPHFTVATYDRRACGRSEIPESGYDIETFAEDLHALVQHLGMAQTYVIGSSAGGPIAMQYALAYPDEVSGLVLVNTAADLLTGEGSERLRKEFEQRRAAGPDALPEPPEGADAATFEATTRLRELIRQLPDEERRRAFEGWEKTIRAYEALDLTPRVYELKMRTYILHGRDDELVPPAAAYALSNRIPRSEARIIGAERHGLLGRRNSGAAELILDRLLKWEQQPA